MLKIIFTTIIIILAGITKVSSQNYLYSYSGDSTSIDLGTSVIETFDGNIVVAGNTTWSSSSLTGILLKLNPAGDTLWSHTFRDTSVDNHITGGYVTQLADSGFILTFSLTNQSCNDFILFFRLNSEGDTIWTKRLGFAHNEIDYVYSILETQDSGFIAVGASDQGNNFTTDMRGLILKLNANGDTLWTKTYKNFDYTYFQDIKQTPESDYIICGTSSDADSTNGFYINLLKIDNSGNFLWIKYFGLPGWSSATNVLNSDDGYLLTGETVINNEFRNYILKTDTAGNFIWCKKYELAPYIGRSSKISKCSAGGYYFSENVSDSAFATNALLLKIDDNGTPLWNGIYNGYPDAEAYGIFEANDGGCLLTGKTNQDILVIKTDSTGFVNCHYSQSFISYNSILPVPIFLPLVISSGINQYDNPMIINRGFLQSNNCTTSGENNTFVVDKSIVTYPNPSNGIINVKGFNSNEMFILNIYNIQGDLIFHKIFSFILDDSITLELKIPDGLYLLQLIENEECYFNKIKIIND